MFGSQAISTKQVHQLYDSFTLSAVGHSAMIALVIMLFWKYVPTSLLVMGAMGHGCIFLLHVWYVARFKHLRKSCTSDFSLSKWVLIAMGGAFVTGLMWGFSASIFSNYSPAEYPFFLAALLIGMAAVAISSLGSVFLVYLSFMFPMISLLASWMLMQEGELYQITGIIALVAIIYFVITARMYNQNLYEAISKKEEIEKTQLEILERLGRASEYRDNETGQHVTRMSMYCHVLSKQMGLDKEFCDLMLYASPMHDIGKIGVADDILKKQAALSDDEWVRMREHVSIGVSILDGHESKLMQCATLIAQSHHEKWDGSGYPYGLKAEQIPIEGRIAAICDVYDALTSERPYKKAWSVSEALAWIDSQSGKHFDPNVVSHFMKIIPILQEIGDHYPDENIHESSKR